MPRAILRLSLSLGTFLFLLWVLNQSLTSISGGLELLFSNQRKHQLHLPSTDEYDQPVNLAFLVRFLCQNLMKDPRKELFVMDGTV